MIQITDEIGMVGAGRTSHEIADLANRCGYVIKHIFDDYKTGIDPLLNAPITNKIDQSLEYVLAMGNPIQRKQIYEKLGSAIRWKKSLIDPNNFIGSRNDIDEGFVMQTGALLSCDAKIGKMVFMNYKSEIHHDAIIGDYCVFSPNTAVLGSVIVGEGVFVGASAAIKPRVKVGEWAVIGMGAMVTKNVDAYHIVAGNPAKVIGEDSRGILPAG